MNASWILRFISVTLVPLIFTAHAMNNAPVTPSSTELCKLNKLLKNPLPDHELTAESLLFNAVQNLEFSLVELLLEKQYVSVNVREKSFNRTPLMMVATIQPRYFSQSLFFVQQALLQTVRILLKNGAKLDLVDDQGATSLMLMIEAGFEQETHLLLDHGASVKGTCKRKHENVTPLSLACKRDDLLLIKRILNVIDEKGMRDVFWDSFAVLKVFQPYILESLLDSYATKPLEYLIAQAIEGNYLKQLEDVALRSDCFERCKKIEYLIKNEKIKVEQKHHFQAVSLITLLAKGAGVDFYYKIA